MDNEVKVETKKKGNGLFTLFACVMTGVIVFLAMNVGKKAGKVVNPEVNTNKESNITSNVESNVTSNVESNSNVVSNSNVTSNTVSNTSSNEKIYAAVINEYKTAIKNNGEGNYKYANEGYFQNGISNPEVKYSFYDINKDGIDEMLINEYVIDVFTFDGKNIVRLFGENAGCLSYGRCGLELYDNGIIAFFGSSGYNEHVADFYTIDGSKLKTLSTYTLIGSNNNYSIYEGNYAEEPSKDKKTSYKTEEELVKANVKGANKVNLSSLTWTKIN